MYPRKKQQNSTREKEKPSREKNANSAWENAKSTRQKKNKTKAKSKKIKKKTKSKKQKQVKKRSKKKKKENYRNINPICWQKKFCQFLLSESIFLCFTYILCTSSNRTCDCVRMRTYLPTGMFLRKNRQQTRRFAPRCVDAESLDPGGKM